MGISDPHCTAFCLEIGRLRAEGKIERLRHHTRRAVNGRRGGGHLALENVQFLLRDMGKGIRINTEILRQDLLGRVGKPVADRQCIEFGKFAVVERQQELAAVRLQALDGVWDAGGKVPKISRADIGDKVAAILVNRGDLRLAIQHEGPFGRQVPMQFPDAAHGQAHVHPGDGLCHGEVLDGDLTRPAARLDSAMRLGKREPQIRDVPVIRLWWGEGGRELPQQCRVVRTRIAGVAATCRSGLRRQCQAGNRRRGQQRSTVHGSPSNVRATNDDGRSRFRSVY